MVFTKEMSEIVDFLISRDDYAIFAGFSAELHTGIESSADIDVFFSDEKAINFVVKTFLKNGWEKFGGGKGDKGYVYFNLRKKETTFDFATSDNVRSVSIPNRERVNFNGKFLYTICKEELFLGKMVTASIENRLESKQIRDKKVVQILRNKVNPSKLKHILNILPVQFFIGWDK